MIAKSDVILFKQELRVLEIVYFQYLVSSMSILVPLKCHAYLTILSYFQAHF